MLRNLIPLQTFSSLAKISGMNERDEFLRLTKSFYSSYVERIQTMTEAQVLDALRSWNAARNNVNETLGFLSSVSLASKEDSGDELTKLKSQLSSTTHRPPDPLVLENYIEDALKKRLEELRNNDK